MIAEAADDLFGLLSNIRTRHKNGTSHEKRKMLAKYEKNITGCCLWVYAEDEVPTKRSFAI